MQMGEGILQGKTDEAKHVLMVLFLPLPTFFTPPLFDQTISITLDIWQRLIVIRLEKEGHSNDGKD